MAKKVKKSDSKKAGSKLKPVKIDRPLKKGGVTKTTAKTAITLRAVLDNTPALDMEYVAKKSTLAVWALNCSPQGGRLLIDLGENTVLALPDCDAPINLLDLVPKQRLLDSVNFRNAIRQRPGIGRVIKVIPAEVAKSLLSRADIQAQQKMLDNRERERMNARNNKGVREKAPEEAPKHSVSTRIVDMVGRRNSGLLSADDFTTALQAMSLTDNDLTYLTEELKSVADRKKVRALRAKRK